MDENKKNIPAEEEPTILTLHDDEGNEEEFEFLDVIEYHPRSSMPRRSGWWSNWPHSLPSSGPRRPKDTTFSTG